MCATSILLVLMKDFDQIVQDLRFVFKVLYWVHYSNIFKEGLR